MHAFAFVALAAAGLATAPIAASAATIMQSITIDIPTAASSDDNFMSSTFEGFDPKIGTLTSAQVYLTGSLTWAPGSPIGPFGAMLALILAPPIPASQVFMSATPDTIDVVLNGVAAGFAIGPGPQQELLEASDSSDGGSFTAGGVLSGTVTYTFTPAVPTVPEPSTWALMLIGFAGLGYVALRRKGAVPAISA
jgi:opacity protein-like surface antigen